MTFSTDLLLGGSINRFPVLSADDVAAMRASGRTIHVEPLPWTAPDDCAGVGVMLIGTDGAAIVVEPITPHPTSQTPPAAREG